MVTKVPAISEPWEDEAGPGEVVAVARAADRLGYHFLTCSEHVAMAPGVYSPQLRAGRGTRYWDPLATLSWLAGQTRRIRLATSVLVLGYHHPLQIAKRYGTLDQISGGRVILGLGVGTVEEEFAVLGAPSPARLREMLARHPDRLEGFEVVVGAGRTLDAIEHPDEVEETLAELAAAGATMVTARPHGRTHAHLLEQLEALAGLEGFTPLTG